MWWKYFYFIVFPPLRICSSNSSYFKYSNLKINNNLEHWNINRRHQSVQLVPHYFEICCMSLCQHWTLPTVKMTVRRSSATTSSQSWTSSSPEWSSHQPRLGVVLLELFILQTSHIYTTQHESLSGLKDHLWYHLFHILRKIIVLALSSYTVTFSSPLLVNLQSKLPENPIEVQDQL